MDAEKRSGWASDILAAWLAERTVAPDVAKDARYVFEASVGQPIRTVGARVEIPDVDHTRQGKPTARFLADIDATGLKRLQAIGFLQQEGSGFRVVLPVPARPEAPKLGVGGPVPTEAPTSGPKARVVKRK